MARAAVRPRMLVLLVVLLAAAAVCARLGAWQLDRAQSRGDQAEAGEVPVVEVRPVPLDDVLPPQTSFAGDLLGRAVTVTGTFDPVGQLLVPGRALDGRTGSVVLTPLRVTGGTDAGGPSDGAADDGAVLPVARGWVASPDDAAAPPAGEVTLTGYLQASEAAGALDVEAGTAEGISTAQLVNVWGGPIYSGYLVLAGSTPPAQGGAIEPLPPPEPRGSGGDVDLRNLGYALQWWIFGLFAVALWLRLVRDEAAGDPLPDDETDAVPDAVPDAPAGAPEVREPAGGASA
jgi:cytochrome oxidase assembly protein ShyY1